MALTDKEYVTIKGSKCPFCGSSEITGGSVEVDGDVAWADVQCDDCESQWVDNYQLSGYDVVTNKHSEQTIETILDEVIDDAVDTCMNDSGYLKSLLREHFSSLSHDDIRKLHHDAFDRDENYLDDE